jgi:hypothetical protein
MDDDFNRTCHDGVHMDDVHERCTWTMYFNRTCHDGVHMDFLHYENACKQNWRDYADLVLTKA